MRLRRSVSIKSTSYHGEMDALHLCINNVHDILVNNPQTIETVHIFSDCKGAIESVTSTQRIQSHQSLKDEFLKYVTKLNMKNIATCITWVSGHADMEANELADDDAKRAADEAIRENLPPVLTNNTFKNICKQRTHKRWQKFWNIWNIPLEDNIMSSTQKLKSKHSEVTYLHLKRNFCSEYRL